MTTQFLKIFDPLPPRHVFLTKVNVLLSHIQFSQISDVVCVQPQRNQSVLLNILYFVAITSLNLDDLSVNLGRRDTHKQCNTNRNPRGPQVNVWVSLIQWTHFPKFSYPSLIINSGWLILPPEFGRTKDFSVWCHLVLGDSTELSTKIQNMTNAEEMPVFWQKLNVFHLHRSLQELWTVQQVSFERICWTCSGYSLK